MMRPGPLRRVWARCSRSGADVPTQAVMSEREVRRSRFKLAYWCSVCASHHWTSSTEVWLDKADPSADINVDLEPSLNLTPLGGKPSPT